MNVVFKICVVFVDVIVRDVGIGLDVNGVDIFFVEEFVVCVEVKINIGSNGVVFMEVKFINYV